MRPEAHDRGPHIDAERSWIAARELRFLLFQQQLEDHAVGLLNSVHGSVLWLLRDNKSAEVNLRREAAAQGIDPSRLVFAQRLPLEEHLARHRLADLFLDTLPFNAHTTASDALWAGLPVLTCQGQTFAGRVAASLLNAVGLPGLVTHSLDATLDSALG